MNSIPRPSSCSVADSPDQMEPTALTMILRHPWIVGAVAGLSLIGAGIYLRVATPLYTSTACLRIQQEAPSVLGSPPPSHSSDETAAFLNAELVVLTSTPVLEMALATPGAKEARKPGTPILLWH